jgi:phosphoribosylformylglycinamidine synthase
MALLGWVPFPNTVLPVEQPRFIHNESGRFESRWVGIKIAPSSAVLLQGMEGSTLGVWVAHGEGKVYFPNPAHLQIVEEKDLAPLRYVDDNNNVTEAYPLNPNGSPNGIAGLCSEDGRHLALMPHPERCFRLWQQPHVPNEWRGLEEGPWMTMFQNARIFCDSV